MCRWPGVRCCVLADDTDTEGCTDVQFVANQYTDFLVAVILCRCSPSEFSSEQYEISPFPVCKTAAHPWPKFVWCFRAANYAEACWLKTLLKTCSYSQMWLMQVSETLHAMGAHPLLVLAEAASPLPLARGWPLLAHQSHHVAGGGSQAKSSLSRSRRIICTSTSGLWAFQKHNWVCPRWIQGFSCCPTGWHSCGDAAPGRKHSQTEGRPLPKPSAVLIEAHGHHLPQDSHFWAA